MSFQSSTTSRLQTTTTSKYFKWDTQAYKEQPLFIHQLAIMEQVISKTVCDHKRTFAVRVDLRLPKGEADSSNKVLKRFFASLKAQIKSHEARKQKAGGLVHKTNLRYIWAREHNHSLHHHYHIVLFFNKDQFSTLGNFESEKVNLFNRIVTAWASALSKPFEEIKCLVHIPKTPYYILDANSFQFTKQFNALFHRVSHFAKVRTKQFGEGHRTFGCSQK